MTDWDLLSQYRKTGSNEAFRKLADRHMKLVYSTCRRDLGDAQMAEDATQLVFILLARKANAIGRGAAVSSWLFGAARFVCKDMSKSEMRRRRREEAAPSMDQDTTGSEEWNAIEPMLNDALATLTESDREAVLMRYYSGMSLAEIAGQIGTTEDTARKRVSRAVDRLRRYFRREPAAANLLSLDALLVAYASKQVPAQTYTAVMSTLPHLAGAAPSTAVALNAHAGVLLKKGAFVLMDVTMKKILIGLAVVAVIGVGVGIPSLVAHARHERMISQTTVTLIDATQNTPAGMVTSSLRPAAYASAGPGSQNGADSKAILGMLGKSLDALRRRDFIHWGDDLAPGFLAYVGARPALTWADLLRQEQQTLSSVGPFHFTVTVRSLQLHGDTADLVLGSHFEATTIAAHQGVAPGIKVVDEEEQEQSWQKVNGRWMATRTIVTSVRTWANGQLIQQLPAPGRATAASTQ